MLFRDITCNLILWGCEIWDLRKPLLDYLKVFLHREIRRVLKINMGQVIDQHIKNSSIQEIFYNIPTVQNHIAFYQITYPGKIFRRDSSHILTCLLTARCDHPRKVGRPLLTNKQRMVGNIRLVITGVEGSEALYSWGFHAPDTQH